MGEVSNGATAEQVVALIAERAAATLIVPGILTLSDLLTRFPASADTAGRYARVSDLYGSVDEILRCRWDGIAYRWIPQRQEYVVGVDNPATTIPVRPLYTAPTLRVTGTVTGSVQVNPQTVNAWVGQRQRVIMAGTLGLGAALNITSLVGGALPLVAGGVRDIEYGPTGWFVAS